MRILLASVSQRVSVPWYIGSVSPYCSAFATNTVFDMTPQRVSVP